MCNKLILLLMPSIFGLFLVVQAGGGKDGQGGSVAEANKKLAAAQRKLKDKTEKKALKAETRKLKIL